MGGAGECTRWDGAVEDGVQLVCHEVTPSWVEAVQTIR